MSDGVVRVVWRMDGVPRELGARPVGPEPVLVLRVLPAVGDRFSPRLGPDRVVAGIEDGDELAVLGEIDGRYLSTEVAGGMTGRMAGVFAAVGSVLIRSFEYRGADEPTARGEMSWPVARTA